MLKELYSGKIIPWERPSRDSDETREILRQIEAEEKYISEILTQEDRERFKTLLYLHKQFAEITEIEIFSYAFSFGALLMVDIYKEAETMEREENK